MLSMYAVEVIEGDFLYEFLAAGDKMPYRPIEEYHQQSKILDNT